MGRRVAGREWLSELPLRETRGGRADDLEALMADVVAFLEQALRAARRLHKALRAVEGGLTASHGQENATSEDRCNTLDRPALTLLNGGVPRDVPIAATTLLMAGGGLSPREAEVLQLLATGLSNRQIAQHLLLSPRTVQRHVANLYLKIGAHNKAEATTYAIRHGHA
jgi:DNA-binding NarL/FixJ family response regulator